MCEWIDFTIEYISRLHMFRLMRCFCVPQPHNRNKFERKNWIYSWWISFFLVWAVKLLQINLCTICKRNSQKVNESARLHTRKHVECAFNAYHYALSTATKTQLKPNYGISAVVCLSPRSTTAWNSEMVFVRAVENVANEKPFRKCE